MPRKREDSFKIAFETLRHELRAGDHPEGARLTANEIWPRLHLSQTPVREALSRLTGEGLLQDRRGQGFFVPALSAQDLVVLFRLQHELLKIALATQRPAWSQRDVERLADTGPDGAGGPALVSERLLRAFAAGCSGALARHLGRLHDQVARVRRAEPRLLDRLEEEVAVLGATLAGDDARATAAVFEQFFARRIAAAPALARLQQEGSNIESI